MKMKINHIFMISILNVNIAFQNMHALFSTINFQNMSTQEFKLFSLIVEQQVENLKLIEDRIVSTSSQHKADKLLRGYINDLILLIHDVEFIADAISKDIASANFDYKKADEFQQALANISKVSNKLIDNRSSPKLMLKDIENLINVMKNELRGGNYINYNISRVFKKRGNTILVILEGSIEQD